MPLDADDLAMFNDPDMPGYAVASFSGGDVAGRFRRAFAATLGMSGSQPTFVAPVNDLADVTEGAAVQIGGVSYTVSEIQVADPGLPNHTRLTLHAT